MKTKEAKRLQYLRKQIQDENISYEEIAELQSLVDFIDKDDVLLLEWAGVPEYPMSLYDCYEDKRLIISDLMQEYVLSPLFSDIEDDVDYSLSTDEITELCFDLIKMWIDKEK